MATKKALVTIFYGPKPPTGTTQPEDPPSLTLMNDRDKNLEPTSYSTTTSTMTDCGTSVSGHLLGSIVRSDVAQISLSWNHLSAEDWSTITGMFEKEYINEIEFFDQAAGDWINRDMYISDRSAGMQRRDSNNNIFWTGCSLQLTEV